ncbi:MAG: bifunctional hydroxymethylpyrimidine kinase/phosphomethylpyrimidine kinase [Bacteroidetes bacterium]|nr:bifunctional hydroxymethylpyrimidine kinase/phosphomethylpyrimidine kinase [Bacteroidota bacterium]
MSLLIVGTVAFDEVETPYGKSGKILGGAATYIGLAASQYTKEINLVSVVGGDFPQEHKDLLKKYSINTDGLKVIPEGKTFFWAGKYHKNMNNRDTLVTDLNVLADFDPILPEGYKTSKYLMLGNLTPAIQRRVIEQMTERPKLICMDTMNFWMNIALDDLLGVLKMIDVLTINDEEAQQLSGENNVVLAAEKILTMGPKFLIVKKGEHGALLFADGKMFHAAAMPLNAVVDPTGAGDTFAGGFMGYIAKTQDISFENMKKALIHASAMASFTVEKFGTDRLTEINEADVKTRIKDFYNLVSFEI